MERVRNLTLAVLPAGLLGLLGFGVALLDVGGVVHLQASSPLGGLVQALIVFGFVVVALAVVVVPVAVAVAGVWQLAHPMPGFRRPFMETLGLWAAMVLLLAGIWYGIALAVARPPIG